MEALHVPDDNDDSVQADFDYPPGVIEFGPNDGQADDDNDKYDRAIINLIKCLGAGYLHVVHVDRAYYYDRLDTPGYIRVGYGPGRYSRRIPLD
jgi:hypothetical protein